jgi:hypothetical protein
VALMALGFLPPALATAGPPAAAVSAVLACAGLPALPWLGLAAIGAGCALALHRLGRRLPTGSATPRGPAPAPASTPAVTR